MGRPGRNPPDHVIHEPPLRLAPTFPDITRSPNLDPETNWVTLHIQQGQLINAPYDYSAELAAMTVPTMLVVGDWDAVRIAHAANFFELLGGGQADAGWDGAGMNANRFAVLPGQTHYTIFASPQLAEAALSFIDAP